MSDERPESGTKSEKPAPPVGRLDTYEGAAGEQARSESRRWMLGIGLAVAVVVILLLVEFATNGWPYYRADNWVASANRLFLKGDLPGALATIDSGVDWYPTDPMVRLTRAQLRLANQDLAGSLADYDRVIELAPTFAHGYSERALVYQRLGKHDEAIADYEHARDLRPEDEANPINNVAYARAIAGRDLETALAEAERAVELAEDDLGLFSFLDTRGYIYHLLGRHDEAVADLDRAIELGQRQLDEALKLAGQQDLPKNALAFAERERDETLSVLYHHRGLAHQALGHQEQADFDLRRADELGYAPERGVF